MNKNSPFCSIFDILTSRTEKIARSLPVFKIYFAYFPIMNNSGKFKEILWISVYCIMPPEVKGISLVVYID